MTDAVAEKVHDLLVAKGPLPEGDTSAFNYVDSGHIDSLGVMQLVVALEEAFDVELSDEAILSDAFRTVGGLISAVHAAQDQRAASAA
ncbi:MAG: acyl carrier protein [Pseudomonadota bacterium]